MTTKGTETGKVQNLALDGVIDISNINDFYSDLNKALNKASEVVVDAATAKRLDSAAMQLLCSWYQAASDKGIKVTWKNSEGVLLNSARLLGLEQFLALK